MSIYEEALVDAKKLKEIAEIEAKNAILEAIAPSIKRMISREAAGLSSPLFEQEEDPELGTELPSDLPVTAGNTTPSAAVTATGSPDAPVSLPPAIAGTDDAPIKASGEDAMNMPLPGPDGKLVVDFEDLFVPADDSEDEQPDEAPASAETVPAAGTDGELSSTPSEVPASATGEAIPPEAVTSPPTEEEAIQITGGSPGLDEEGMSYETFRESLNLLSKRIDKAFKKASVPALVKEALQEKLFESCETLEELTLKSKISPRLVTITENRLEFLHMKLKETLVGTNYQRTEEGNDNMSKKDLKKFASKLLEETDTLEAGEVTSPADSHQKEGSLKVDNAPTEKGADKAGNHAKEASKPVVTLKTEASKDDDESDDMDETKIYETELKKLEEELKEVLAAEDGEQDLVGAGESIPNKKVGAVDTTKSTAGSKSVEAAKVLSVKTEAKKDDDDDDDDLDEWIEHDTHGKGGAPGSEQEVGSVSETKKDDDDDMDEVLEVKDDELAEAVRSIKKENIKRRIRQLKEALVECEMDDEGTMPIMPHAEDEGMMGGVPGSMGSMKDEQWGPPPRNREDEQATINFNFDLDDLGMGDMDDEDDIDIVDDDDDEEEGPEGGEEEEPGMELGAGDEGDEESELGVGSDEEGPEGEEEEEPEEGVEDEDTLPPPGIEGHAGPLMERRRRAARAKKLQEAKQVKTLRVQLAESHLWNAKVLYLNKFLFKEDLSKNQKAKIAEYLDKAKTLEEAKTIYGRVKKLLEGATSSKRKQAGSSSRVVSRGAAGREVLAFRTDVMESVHQQGTSAGPSLFEGAQLVASERNRLMELAGIKKRS